MIMDNNSSEDGPPLLNGLFSDERGSYNSTDEDSYSESDREWRDAVKAAVETEIQYQVQLRLSLDSPTHNNKNGDRTSNDESNQRIYRRERRVLDGKADVEHLANHKIGSIDDTCIVEQASVAVDASPIRSTSHDQRHHSIKEQQIMKVVEGEKPAEKKEPQTVYDYLHQKYGTCYEQLQSLMSTGKFQCINGKECGIVGMDERIRWPTECNITQPSPKLTSTNLQVNVPFFPDGPILGHARPSFHRTPQDCTAVFEKTSDTQVLEDGVLKFESRFESGNLHQAIKVGPFEYDLILSTDLYTERHTQWFYFQVEGMKDGVSYVFNIINFRKRSSLYNNGMKLLMYSETDEGWSRVGQNICYRKLPPCTHTTMLKQGTEYYYLSWKMVFPHTGDKCFFTHCYPYSFSHLLQVLDTYEKDGRRKEYISRQVLCETLAGNECPLLTITDFKVHKEEWSDRMGVVFTSRVHPGETNSSWMMEGIIEFLTSEHKHAKYLRSKYVFKIIPMLNPDGVIVGNYRTSLSGVDLNRVYKNPIENLFPTVAATKKLIRVFNEERKVALYVDLHGHSRSYNVFMYGCRHTPQCDHQQFLEERAVPWMLSQISKEKFSFKKCKFAVQRCKESTGRISIWREGIANSFTMEASFCGTNLTKPTPVHFTSSDLVSMGRDLCEVLLKLHCYNNNNSYRFKVNSRIAESVMEALDKEDTVVPPPVVLLPDVVTSNKDRSEIEKQIKRKNRKQMAKILQRFHATSLKKLEVESSTSGSDSDNDEFKYKNKSRSKNKQKRNKQLKLLQKRANGNQLDNKLPKLEQSSQSTKSNADCTMFNKNGQASRIIGQHGSVNSAPPRLQGVMATHSNHGWRFVNKYTNRSNGGIPIFSQERSRERAEKKEKLRSLSQIQNSEVAQLPQLISPSAITTNGPLTAITSLQRRGSEHSLNLPSLIWKPTDSQRHIPQQLSRNELFKRGYNQSLESGSVSSVCHSNERRRHSDIGSRGNSLTHYQSVKKLVETQRRFSVGQPSPRPHGAKGHSQPPLPVGLPPQLCQYISDIWQKHSRTL